MRQHVSLIVVASLWGVSWCFSLEAYAQPAQPVQSSRIAELEQDNERLRQENERLRAQVALLREALEAGRSDAAVSSESTDDPGTTRVIVVQSANSQVGNMTPQITVTRPVPLERSTDEARGVALLHTRFVRFQAEGAMNDKLWLRVQRVERDGSSGAGGDEVELVIETRDTRNLLESVDVVTLDIDGQRVDCPVLAYSSDGKLVRRGRTRMRFEDERLRARIDPAALGQIVASQNTKITVGDVTTDLSMDQVLLFAAMNGR